MTAPAGSMAGRWLLETSYGPCGAAVLVLATGPWHVPRRLEVPGIEEFNGPVLHTARWDHGVDSAGRRVTVVGSGASAVQVVPAIEAQAASVGLFQRTAQWVLPKSDLLLPAAFNRLLDRVPGARGALRAGRYALQEGFGHACRRPQGARLLEAGTRAHLRLAVRDRQLRRQLTPDYRLGCKRLLTSSPAPSTGPCLSRIHPRRTCPALSPALSDKAAAWRPYRSSERRAAMTWCPIPTPHHCELHDHLLPGTGPVRSLPHG
ncbi:NAD(P)/FAD-dependent oxidoreductase [Streptomyces mirabilis]|uniref:NAD(P)/FAD-dependent oxidoreductase n=1 Tax=Streptomyces mirabilis TaxID=68239 RepID=UPI0031BBA369